MNGTTDEKEAAMTDGGDLDPREARRLLDQSERDARDQFNLYPPVIPVLQGAVVLVGFGAVWLSVRGQHPYTGPSRGSIAIVYVTAAVLISVFARVQRRASAGVSGRTQRQMKVEGAAVAVAYIATATVQGALLHDGASHAIVYGIFPAAMPLVVVGSTLAGINAVHEDWPMFALALAVVAVGVGASFAGPINVWLVAGIGVFVVVLCYAITRARLHRTGWHA